MENTIKKVRLPSKNKIIKNVKGWMFVLPALILMAVFTFYPIISAFIGAFKNNYLGLTGRFSGWGFENFVRVVKADTGTGGANFVNCLVNTLIFTFVSVPVSTVLALIISVALNSIEKVQKAYQTIFFLPYLTNSLAMGAVFLTFFQVIGHKNNLETIGLVNLVLGKDGTNYINWVGTGSNIWYNRLVVIIYEIWSGLPFKILILFSSLQSVNKQYYDAARVDGASRNTILWRITTPLISPQISYLLITGLMGGMKQYTAVVGIFDKDMGGDYKVGTIVGYIYQYIENGYTGYAYAASIMLFAIIMVMTIINLRVSKKRVYY